jgi:hypothetical protein
MLVNFDVPLTDYDGEVIKTEKMVHGKLETVDLTLKLASLTALSAMLEKDKEMDGETKFKNYKIGLKISENSNKCELTTTEVANIKARLALVYGPIVVGRAWTLLESINESL